MNLNHAVHQNILQHFLRKRFIFMSTGFLVKITVKKTTK